MESKENKEFRDSNIINVSNKKKANNYVNIGKMLLGKHGSIEMHAIGNAVSTCAIAAENLVK